MRSSLPTNSANVLETYLHAGPENWISGYLVWSARGLYGAPQNGASVHKQSAAAAFTIELVISPKKAEAVFSLRVSDQIALLCEGGAGCSLCGQCRKS